MGTDDFLLVAALALVAGVATWAGTWARDDRVSGVLGMLVACALVAMVTVIVTTVAL